MQLKTKAQRQKRLFSLTTKKLRLRQEIANLRRYKTIPSRKTQSVESVTKEEWRYLVNGELVQGFLDPKIKN